MEVDEFKEKNEELELENKQLAKKLADSERKANKLQRDLYDLGGKYKGLRNRIDYPTFECYVQKAMAFFAISSMLLLVLTTLGTNPALTIANYRNDINDQMTKVGELEERMASMVVAHKKAMLANDKIIESLTLKIEELKLEHDDAVTHEKLKN